MLSGSLGSGGSDQSHVTLYQPYFLHPFFALVTVVDRIEGCVDI